MDDILFDYIEALVRMLLEKTQLEEQILQKRADIRQRIEKLTENKK